MSRARARRALRRPGLMAPVIVSLPLSRRVDSSSGLPAQHSCIEGSRVASVGDCHVSEVFDDPEDPVPEQRKGLGAFVPLQRLFEENVVRVIRPLSERVRVRAARDVGHEMLGSDDLGVLRDKCDELGQLATLSQVRLRR